MLEILSEATEQIDEFRAKPWPFQRTFQTPLKDLTAFVNTALATFPVEAGVLTSDQVVFEPKNLLHLLERHSVAVQERYHFIIGASDAKDVVTLLKAALSDWLDFLFLAVPETCAIYADHDEYTTFYAPSEAILNALQTRMEKAGFKTVSDYTRDL